MIDDTLVLLVAARQKPGTSMMEIIGILKALQVRIKRALFATH